jgi:flagellar biosynthetic protein FliR
MYNLVAATLLFASGGYVFIVRGFVRSGDVLTTFDTKNIAQTALATMAVMMVAAFEIALPVVAALLCAEIALALLGKAAPQLNVFQLGFAVKIFIGLSLLGVVVLALPSQTEALLNKFLEMMGA